MLAARDPALSRELPQARADLLQAVLGRRSLAPEPCAERLQKVDRGNLYRRVKALGIDASE